jgi:hypothetical protein
MPFEYHKDLNSKFWKEFKLDKSVSGKLVDIALDFYRNLKTNAPLEDIELTGSLTNYTYTKKSDLDLHLRLDFSKVKAKPDLVKQLFEGEKYKWNLNHDIVIRQHPVEIYIEDISVKPYATKPVYSLLKNKWIQKPAYNPPEIDEQNVNKKFEAYKNEIDSLVKLLNKSDCRIIFRQIHNRAKALRERLADARKECMQDKTTIFDFCIENLVFKKLRDAGYLDKLNDLKLEAYDKIFTEQTWNSGLHTLFMSDLMGKQKKTKDPRHMKPVIRDPGTRKHVRTVPKMHQNLDTFPEVGMLKKAKGRKIVSEPRAMQIAAFYNITLGEKPTKLGRSPVSIRKKNNIYVLES